MRFIVRAVRGNRRQEAATRGITVPALRETCATLETRTIYALAFITLYVTPGNITFSIAEGNNS